MTAEDEIKKRLKRREDMFLRRLFGMLGKMAKADGAVDAWETHAAEKAFAHWPRAAARRKYCAKMFNEGKDSTISLYRMAWDFANKGAAQEDCLFAYGLLWDIACAKGVLHGPQKDNLEGICKYLNLPNGYFRLYYRMRQGSFREWTAQDERREQERVRKERERQEAEHQGESERSYQQRMWDWYRQGFRHDPPPQPKPVSPLQKEYDLLECASDATDEEVLKAYRAAAKKHHPDLLRAKGCSESLIQKATIHMTQINAAWERIKRARASGRD